MIRTVYLALLWLACTPSWAATVLVIESYHPEYPWDADYLKAIDEVLGGAHTINTLYLDTKRLPPAQFDSQADKLTEQTLALAPDVILMGDDNALAYMGPRLKQANIPIVFFGVNGTPAQYGLGDMEMLTGVLERPLFRQTVRHLRKVLTQKDRFLVLMDDSETMRNAVNEAWGDSRQIDIQGSQLDLLLTNEAERWQEAIRTAHLTYDAVIFGTHHTLRYRDQRYAEPDDLMALAYRESRIPLFAFWDFFVGEGMTAGGYVLSGYDQGKTAARMADLILRDIHPSSIPIIQGEAGNYLYSRSGMERWNVRLSTLTATQTTFID
ncbi:ABC transporter substrate-binding protein [Saccharospirillum impatiens]|uniref:ABC transporter substrate-binding protein n=1 Tax=Saccharospirillum impatiens TaxID=169438 RepID=UPI0004160FE4|nr:hypothetical protein [Saccharospirillum impatiens]